MTGFATQSAVMARESKSKLGLRAKMRQAGRSERLRGRESPGKAKGAPSFPAPYAAGAKSTAVFSTYSAFTTWQGANKEVAMESVVQAFKSGDRKRVLDAMALKIAKTIDVCESARDMPALTKRMVEIMDAIEKCPDANATKSKLAVLQANAAKRKSA